MLRLSIITAALLVSISVSAGENAFNANLENPSVSTLITEFEKVCFPFISHQTELTAQQDREVFQSRMVEAEYAFEDEKEWKQWTPLHKFSYAPANCPKNEIPIPPPPRLEGNYTVFPGHNFYKSSVWQESRKPSVSQKFTVYNGLGNSQEVESTTTIVGPMCEVLMVSMMPSRYTNYARERYKKMSDRLVSASLIWQEIPDFIDGIVTAKRNAFSYNSYESFKVRTSFPPASSCGIHIYDENLTADMIESAVIAHDPDWEKQEVTDLKTKEVLPDAHNWVQCTKQDEENYVYSVNLSRGTLSMKVKTLQDEEVAPSYNCKSSRAQAG